MTYHNAQKYILNAPDESSQKIPGNNLKRIWSILGYPQKNLNYMRLAGSNGKTITSEMLVSVFKQTNYTVGALTTTLRTDLRYNISINGSPISFEKMAEYVSLIYKIVNGINKNQSNYFASEDNTIGLELPIVLTKQEILLTVALIAFKENNCDLCLIESDHKHMDPTVFLPPPFIVAICGAIPSQDKADVQMIRTYICHGIEEIISSPQDKNAYRVISNACASVNCRLTIPTKSALEIQKSTLSGSEFLYKERNYKISLCGKFQINNAIFVLELLDRLIGKGFDISYDQIFKGLVTTKIPTKFEILSIMPTIIADSTHSDVAISAVCESMSEFKSIIGNKIRVCLPNGSIVERYQESLTEQGYSIDKIIVFNDIQLPPSSLNNTEIVYCTKVKDLIKVSLEGLDPDEILLISGRYSFTLDVRYELLSYLGF